MESRLLLSVALTSAVAAVLVRISVLTDLILQWLLIAAVGRREEEELRGWTRGAKGWESVSVDNIPVKNKVVRNELSYN